jgi:hypothetical protein
MDPDEALRIIRLILHRMSGEGIEYVHDAQCLAEEVEALDAWLSKGGVLPNAWDGRRTGRD